MARTDETRLLARALRDPRELKRKLVLAIALAPPKSRTKVKTRRMPRRGR